MRRTLALALAATAVALAVSVSSAHAYRWPIAPFDVQHPIRGYFGDPRIDGANRSFHSGVDIAAPAGTPVYPVMSGYARITGRMKVAVFGAREFSYWHIVPSVHNGEWVTAGRTILGHITARWLHVHFMEWSGGIPINPLHPDGLEPYVDHTRPRIDAMTFERNGSTLDPLALAGTIDVIVDAHDEPALSAPPPWADLPVAPALIRWRILAGANVARPWKTAADFRGLLPPVSEFEQVYAPGTTENSASYAGRYRFYLARDWYVNELPDGDYVTEIAVSDTAGNTSTADVPFSVIAWMRAPRTR